MKNDDEVAIFWDYGNCAVPANTSGYTIVNKIRSIAQTFGSIKLFKAYLEASEHLPLSRSSELQSSGVSLTSCPHNGRKDVADKMIIVDMLAHAIDNPPPSTIVLISGDRDFAYALSILGLRRYHIVLITLSNAHQSLREPASLCFNWNSDILGTVDPTSVLHQPTSPRRGKTPMPPTYGSCRSDILNPSCDPLIISTFQKCKIYYLQDKAKYKDTCLTPPNRDSGPEFLPPELEPSKRQLTTSMTSTNLLRNESPAPVIYSPVASSCHAHLNDSIDAETSHDSNSSQILSSSSGKNTPEQHDGSMASSEPEFSRGFSPLRQNAYSTKSYKLSSVDNQIYDDSDGDSDPGSPSSFTLPPSSLNHTTAAVQSSVKTTTNRFIKPLPLRAVPHKFKILIKCLKSYRSKGNHRPLRSVIALEIARNGVTYRQAGVTKFHEYTAMAENEGYIELGGCYGTAWIALSERWV